MICSRFAPRRAALQQPANSRIAPFASGFRGRIPLVSMAATAWCWPASARCADTVASSPGGLHPIPIQPVLQAGAEAAVCALSPEAQRWVAMSGVAFGAKPGSLLLVPSLEVRPSGCQLGHGAWR